MNTKVKNRLSFLGYHLLAIIFILVTLNDFRIINLYESNGNLARLGDTAFNIVNSTTYTQKPASEDIQIILTNDIDISQFPLTQDDDQLDDLYIKIIRDARGAEYVDAETGEVEFIEYEEVREEFCTMMHPDSSASRYGVVTALKNILSQEIPPKLILLDYIYLGTSSRCQEYDEELSELIKTHPEIIVIASGVKAGGAASSLFGLDPGAYIRDAKRLESSSDSEIQDAMIFPYFKEIYQENKSLKNIGSGNVIVEAPVVMEARLDIITKNYKVPTVSRVMANYLNKRVPDTDRVAINWRSNLYKHKSISSAIMPINDDDYKTAPIVIFGSNLTGKSADKMYTPIMDKPTPGVYVQATILDNIINNDFIEKAPNWVTVTLIIIFIFVVHLSYFGILVNMMPQDFFLSRLYRNDLVSNMQDYFAREVIGLKLFVIYELIALLSAGIILYTFGYYVDVVTPVIVGSTMWTLMKVVHYFVMKRLIKDKGLMTELVDGRYNMYFIKCPGSLPSKGAKKEFVEQIEPYFQKNLRLVEFSPFNSSGIFGYRVVSKYYWWVSTRSMNPDKVSCKYQVQKIKCREDEEAMSIEFRSNISKFWSEK